MKLNKILSLILVIGSLSTISNFLNSKAANNFEDQVKSGNIDEKQSGLHENNELQVVEEIKRRSNTRRLYKAVIAKSLAPMKRGGSFGANISFIRNMAENVDDYIDFIASYFVISKEHVNNEMKERFINTCNEILRYANEFFVQPLRNENNVLHHIEMCSIRLRFGDKPLDFNENDG